MYCAQASMMAAEQRLRDAGYGEKYLHVPDNADDSDDQQVMEDEVIDHNHRFLKNNNISR